MTTKTAATKSATVGFTDEERAAMKEHARELKESARRTSAAAKAEGDRNDVLAKIAEMQDPDRALAERIHAIITTNAPELAPKLWYGMPSYALDGKIVCFFQAAEKFKARYATFGFNDIANLDDGSMWPAAYALTKLTSADETHIAELVKKAVS
ncbi:DUF1801 domain-containing protein [Nocardia sp. NPDC051030]|uniref:iron chaperone n=1 Tax=Nocardia sp. NPDC051030 TaxID=3155162 RepID=UPI003433D27B